MSDACPFLSILFAWWLLENENGLMHNTISLTLQTLSLSDATVVKCSSLTFLY